MTPVLSYSMLKHRLERGEDLSVYDHTDPILAAAFAQRKILDYAISQRIKELAEFEEFGDE